MSKNHIAIVVSLVLLMVGVGWAMGYFAGEDPQIAELERMRDENFNNQEGLSREQRREQWNSYREKERALSPEQREELSKRSRPFFQKMANERMNEFFALSPEEQTKRLDEIIDRMESWRKERSQGEGGGGSQDGRGGRGSQWQQMSQQQRDRKRQERLDQTTPEMRAKFDRFRDMMNERREQRGLDPVSGRGPWGGRR